MNIMKKITLSIFLLAFTFVSAQEFPLNFTNPNQLFTGVGGATTSLVPDPIASANQVLSVVGNGQPYDTAQLNLLTSYINLADDNNNTITFRVRPAADYGTRTHLLKFEALGSGSGAASTELPFTTSGTAWTNVSLNFPAGLGNYKLMVIFPDFNNGSVGTYLFDDFAGGTNVAPPAAPVGPAVNSPVPPSRPVADVVSIYSDAYTSISPINLDAGWCGTSAVEATTAGGTANNVLAYKLNACQGITFPSDSRNLTGFTRIHVDFFIATGTATVGKVFNLKIVPTTGGGANDVEINLDINALTPAPVPGTWYSFDRAFTAAELAKITASPIMHEFGVTSNLNNTVWYDNLYIHKNTVLSNETFKTSSIKMYPNPTANVLNIEALSTIDKVTVYNILGQEVISKTVGSSSMSLDVSDLHSGVYVINATIEGVTSTSKFVKK
jgi:hypothetical protein